MASGRKEARVQTTAGTPCSFVATSVKDFSDRLRYPVGTAEVEPKELGLLNWEEKTLPNKWSYSKLDWAAF